MVRKCARLGFVVFVFAALATAAWADSRGPKPDGYYASKKPDLSVYVDKPATTVDLYIGCDVSSTGGESWDSSKLKFKKDKFSFEGKTTVTTESGATFTHFKATVLFTGEFSGGEFRGTAQIVGSACPKGKYTAKYDKNGSGSGA